MKLVNYKSKLGHLLLIISDWLGVVAVEFILAFLVVIVSAALYLVPISIFQVKNVIGESYFNVIDNVAHFIIVVILPLLSAVYIASYLVKLKYAYLSQHKKNISVIILTLLLPLTVLGVYYFSSKTSPITTMVEQPANPSNSPKVNSLSPVSSQLTNCTEDSLNLLSVPKNYDTCVTMFYVPVGTVPVGKYSGFQRIAAVMSQGPGSQTYLLATNDKQHYVMQGTITASAAPDPNAVSFNPAKVTTVNDLMPEHPQVINLDQNFALYRGEIMLNYPGGYFTNLTDFSGYRQLSSPRSDLKMYAENRTEVGGDNGDVRNKYIQNMTDVIVVDSQGLAVNYNLTMPQVIKQYQDHGYNRSQYFPGHFNLPDIRFSKADIQSDVSLYDKYDTIFPGGCGGQAYAGVLSNITDNDLLKIGTVYSLNLYILKDQQHPLYSMAYSVKSSFKDTDKQFPTLQGYISKNPLLIIKDFWSRWILIGEDYYVYMAPCG